MISVEELIYEFKLTLNKVNRQDNVDIPIEDIIFYNFLRYKLLHPLKYTHYHA